MQRMHHPDFPRRCVFLTDLGSSESSAAFSACYFYLVVPVVGLADVLPVAPLVPEVLPAPVMLPEPVVAGSVAPLPILLEPAVPLAPEDPLVPEDPLELAGGQSAALAVVVSVAEAEAPLESAALLPVIGLQSTLLEPDVPVPEAPLLVPLLVPPEPAVPAADAPLAALPGSGVPAPVGRSTVLPAVLPAAGVVVADWADAIPADAKRKAKRVDDNFFMFPPI